MSDTDSESEGDKIRRTRRSVVVKFKFEDTDSSSEDDVNEMGQPAAGPSARPTTTKRSRKLPSTDSESDDSAPIMRRIQATSSATKKRLRQKRPYIYDLDDSSDTEWSPFVAAGATTSSLPGEPGPSGTTPRKEQPPKEVAIAQSDAESSSDSGDDAIEKCPICLHGFREQEVGTPNVCEHNYCAPCIDEWSKNVQTCPIDRKAFTSIRVRANLHSRDCLREVQVQANAAEPRIALDITQCEICNLSDREDTMLLCDGCDQGYHMDCLIPALTEIPEGRWFCDNCFGSDTSEEDISQLIEEMEMEVGIPETRLRVRRIDVPRITRTRQSERIRETILSRRRGAESDAAYETARPGPSRITTTTTTSTITGRRTTTTSTVATRPRKAVRRRRKARRRRTYVVEYDVDSFDKKFSIKTTKKVIKRRRKTKRKTASRRSRCSSRRTFGQNEGNDAATSMLTKRSLVRSIEANYPKLHLFGNKNDLEYFPDDESDNDHESGRFESNNDLGGARGEALVMSSARFSMGVNRGLLKGKQMGSVRRRPTATVTSDSMASTDLLSNIMNTMDRWYSMSNGENIEKIKIGADGKLSIDGDSRDANKPPKSCPVSTPSASDVVNAPRNGPANDGNIQVGTSCQSNNDDRAGNDGGSFQMGGNGMSTEGGSASTETGTNAHRQGSGGGGVGPSDLGVTDSNAEPPRNRIMTRRRSKSALAPPPSLDEFPALNSCSDGLDLTMNSANQQNATATPNRIMTRRRSALAPPPSLDEFPALSGNNQSIPSGNQATPQTERTPGRVGLRRKSQLAATPALDSFSGLTSIDENAASAQTNNSQPSETPRRIMTRRRSNLAQPPTLDSFPALANTEGNGTPVASQPTRIMTRRRSATLAPPPSIMEFPALVEPIAESDVPDEACPPPPVPEIFGLFDEDDESGAAIQQPPPLSNYSFANSYMGSSPYSQNYGVLPPPVSASTIHESSSSVIAPDLSSSSVSPSKFVSKKKTAMSGGASSNTSPAAAAEEVNALPSAIDLNHKPTKIEWKNSPLKKKSVFNNSDDEDGGFQYSAESLEVAIKKHDAKNQKKGSDESKSDASENMEKDEDLVQLDDDDDVDDDDDDDETVTDDQPPTEKPIETVDDVDQSLAAKKNILDLHDDSDWEELRDDQFEDKAKQKPSPRKDDGTKEKPENERSYTPCMDEQVVREEAAEKSAAVAECDENESTHTPDLPESHGRTSAGIDNMDTELISEDEDTDLLHDESGVRKDSAKKSKKKKKAPSKERENDEEFRKLSKSTKERRYREQRNKSASRSRSPSRRRTRSGSRDSRSHHRDSRSWSRNRRFNNGNNNNNNNSRGRRTLDQRFGRNAKRREIQRYNVRNVVADRQSRNYKDQYGRDEARPNRSPSRSPSPRRRSPARRSFSVSRSRSRSPYRRRRPSADSVRRSGSPQRRSIRSLSRSVSPKFTRYSRTPPNAANGAATTRSVSGSPRNRSGKTKSRKIKKKSGEKKSSKRRTKQRKNRDGSVSGADSQIEDRPRVRSRSKSWDANVRNRSWSRSVSPQPIARHSPEPNESWTPPIGPGSENLRITLANREKKKRREKKKKSDKHRSEQRKEKKRQRTETHLVTSNRPSKEVFASGDNILVSVSFNKEKEKTTQQQQTTIVTLPPTKDQIQTKKQTERNKKSSKDPNRKRKKLNVKPVAIIDLDNSPFKEMTPSPRAVIILSDSDNEREGNKENTNQQRGGLPNAGDPSKAISQPNDVQEHAVEVANSPPASPTMDNESFEMLSMGPKTPPEPRIKFALPKAKVRVVANPLHDTADDQNEDETNETDAVASQEAPANLQVPPNKAPGPNTPSDVGPYSPDAYDPFEPTKSPSPPPSTSESAQQPAESNSNIDSGPKKPSTENDAGDKESSLPDVIIVSPRSGDKAVADDATGSKPSSIHVFSNIVLSTGKETSARSQQPTQRSHSLFPPPTTSNTITPNKPGHSQAAKPSPMKFASSSLLARLPLPPSTKQSKSGRHNGNDGDGIGGESPYSPQSSDYDDLFEPPPLSPGPSTKKSSGNTRGTAGAGAVVFDDLFGSTSPTHVKLSKSSLKASKSSKHHEKSSIKEWLAVNKQSTQSGFGKAHNDQNRNLDDIPASAVELQAKDKYLRKLNRQERVVEEVKLILKPHYNRKTITKDEYKDIMRKAVPKICHNPTGEINPKKIKNLIDAYVKKFRYRRKNAATAVAK